MTTKNAKNTMLIAALIFSVAVPLTSFDLVLGQSENNAVINEGRTIIEPEFKKPVKSDRTELNALEDAFSKATTEQERESIKAEALKILKNKPQIVVDPQRTAQYTEAKDVLVDSITSMPKQDGHNAIPFTQVGYNAKLGMLEIKIHQDFANIDNMRQYEKTIRSIIGNEIDLKISNGGEYWQSGTCPNGPLNDCDPLESGVEMQVTNHGNCTIGMRATFDGDNGFVTAGHCADGEKDSDVGQDSISSVIGTVSRELYDSGSSFETCDCAFIEIDSGTRTMDPEVYWQSYYPTSAADASVNDYVKMYGKSGITYGYVENTCDDITNTDGTTLKCVVIFDNAFVGGDSGSYVAQTFDATPEFHGIAVDYNTGLDKSAYVKHGKFTVHFSGLSWDFS